MIASSGVEWDVGGRGRLWRDRSGRTRVVEQKWSNKIEEPKFRGQQMRILGWVGTLIFVLIAAAAILVATVWFRASDAGAPSEGQYSVSGVSERVEIIRDENGVPHIVADDELDALFALGFVQAQDRLWQMDLTRRQTQGRLAEIFGSLAVGSDKYLRAYDFKSNVDRTWASLEGDDKARLQAYADGVNAWINDAAFKKPAEYVFTFTAPEPWKPQDSLYVHKAIWLTLSANASGEFQRQRLRNEAPAAIAKAWFPPYPEDGHVAMEWSDLARTLNIPIDDDLDTEASEDAQETDEDQPIIGAEPVQENSNNWVVDGTRTASGAPMLADDPHLTMSLPGFWHLFHMNIGGRNIFGAGVPGIPGVVVGRSDVVSWGVTNNRTDVQDIYLERINPDNADQYETPDGWQAFETRTETIKVRFKEDVVETYRRSRHGPVIPNEPINNGDGDDEYFASLAWTSDQLVDTSVPALMATYRLNKPEEFLDTLRAKYIGPVQNLVFAHEDGTIGLIVAGRAPIRSDAHETSGSAPSDGANADNDWQGYVPPDMIPVVINPTSGALVTANAKVVPDEYPFERVIDHAGPSRQKQIQTLIDSYDAHTVESFRAIHMDVGNTDTKPLSALLLKANATTEAGKRAKEIIADWDGRWEANSLAPLVYATWTAELSSRLYKDDLGERFERSWGYRPDFLFNILSTDNSAICDDITTDAPETCADMIDGSLTSAAANLEEAYGPDLSKPWGEVFVTRFNHLGLGDIPVLGKILSRAEPRAAGPGAPNVGYFSFKGLPAEVDGGIHGASLRMVFDMSDIGESYFAIPNGQSGHFKSPHYDDLLPKWLAGEYINITTDLATIKDPKTTVLSPN